MERPKLKLVTMSEVNPNSVQKISVLPEQCGTCEHYRQMLMNRGFCEHPKVAVIGGGHALRGRDIYEEDKPPTDCPL